MCQTWYIWYIAFTAASNKITSIITHNYMQFFCNFSAIPQACKQLVITEANPFTCMVVIKWSCMKAYLFLRNVEINEMCSQAKVWIFGYRGPQVSWYTHMILFFAKTCHSSPLLSHTCQESVYQRSTIQMVSCSTVLVSSLDAWSQLDKQCWMAHYQLLSSHPEVNGLVGLWGSQTHTAFCSPTLG